MCSKSNIHFHILLPIFNHFKIPATIYGPPFPSEAYMIIVHIDIFLFDKPLRCYKQKYQWFLLITT